MRIVILTSAHPVFDKRVFQRHAQLLRRAGHDVHLVAPHRIPRQEHSGIQIHGFKAPRNKRERLLQLPRVFRLALSLRGDLYHLHDPDLLAIGWRLRRALGVPVVYDSHEDFSLERDVLGVPTTLVGIFSRTIGWLERVLARRLDAVVSPHRTRLAELRHPKKPALFLPNYPPRNVFEPLKTARTRSLLYSGLLSRSRGAQIILDAAERMPDVTFVLLAKFMLEAEDDWFRSELRKRSLRNVDFRGFVEFNAMPAALSSAGVGIMPWMSTRQHVRAAQPSKLYEYMACALPILASDLPITRELVELNGCGMLHADTSIDDFVSKGYRLLDDQETSAVMGIRGRRAFEERYSYEAAGEELLALYATLQNHQGSLQSLQVAAHPSVPDAAR